MSTIAHVNDHAVQRIPLLFRVMATMLTLGLAGAFALGFGAPIPQEAVIACIAAGTMAMVLLFAALIGGSLRIAPPVEPEAVTIGTAPVLRSGAMRLEKVEGPLRLAAGNWIAGSAVDMVPKLLAAIHTVGEAKIITLQGETIGILARSNDLSPYSCLLRADFLFGSSVKGQVSLRSDGQLDAVVEYAPGSDIFDRPPACTLIVRENGRDILRLA